jgi:hypothetical protein
MVIPTEVPLRYVHGDSTQIQMLENCNEFLGMTQIGFLTPTKR